MSTRPAPSSTLVALMLFAAVGCASPPVEAGADASPDAPVGDAGRDAARTDASGALDGGHDASPGLDAASALSDAGSDAAVGTDAIVPDALDTSAAVDGGSDAGADSAVHDGGLDANVDAGWRGHLVDETVAFAYAETQEATNGDTAGSEMTGYTLSVNGAIFSGTFEGSSPTTDCFRFQTSAYSHVDVQVFLDGLGLTGSPGTVFVSIDAVPVDGLSSLFGFDYVNRATVTPSTLYRVCATPQPSAAGMPYTIEIRPSP